MNTTSLTEAQPTRHIRTKGKMRADRRFRFQIRINGVHSRQNINRHPTICGAEPTEHDVDRDDAAHFIKHSQIQKLKHWAADICLACRGGL